MCFAATVIFAAVGFAAESEEALAIRVQVAATDQMPASRTLWSGGGDWYGVLEAPVVRHGLKWATGDILISDPAEREVKPSIAGAPNGDLFVVVENEDLGDRMSIYRSNDGGNTWSHLVLFGTSPQSRNPALAYAEDGAGEKWLFVAYEVVTSDIERRARMFRVDPDNLGEFDFTTIRDAIPWTVPAHQLHPQIANDNILFANAYYLYVTYAIPTIDYYPVYFSITVDRGLNWSTPVNVTGGSENTSWQTRPEIAYGSAGLFIAYVKPGWNGSSWTNQIWATRSTNFGSNWDTPQQLTGSSARRFHPAVAVANGGNEVVVAYSSDLTTDTDASFVASTDGGLNWTSSSSLPFSFDDEGYVDLAVSRSSPGRFHAVYLHEINDIWYTWASTSTPTVWSSEHTVNTGSQASGVSYYPRPTVAVNPTMSLTQEAAISWSDWRGPSYDAYFNGPAAVGASIFADGFESGNTTAWSSTVP